MEEVVKMNVHVICATFGRFSSEFVRARAEPPAKLARRRPGKQFACGFGNHRIFQGMPLVRSLRLRDIVYLGNREKGDWSIHQSAHFSSTIHLFKFGFTNNISSI